MSEKDHIRGWTLVSDGGDVESDSGSTGSFVHLEPDQVVSYHHKSSRSPSLESYDSTETADRPIADPDLSDPDPSIREDDTTLSVDGDTSIHCENLDSDHGDVEELKIDDIPQELPNDTPNLPEQAVRPPSALSDVKDEDAETERKDSVGESCVRSPSPDTLDMVVVSALTAPSEAALGDVFGRDGREEPAEGDETTENSASTETSVNDGASSTGSPLDLHLSEMELSSQEREKTSSTSSEIEELDMPDDEEEPLMYEEVRGDMTLVHPSISKLQVESGAGASESESELSDIVRLDPTLAEELPLCPERRRYFPAADLMQASASSSSSSSSSRFHFVQPLPIQPAIHRYVYPRGDDQEDDESLPGDIDDRCESDISGVAPDDNDPDLSSVSYNLDDLEIYEGDVVRSYKHKPNSTLNAFLSTLALLTLFMTIGVGIGHYLGTVRETGRRNQQTARMMEIQDEYLHCLRQQEVLQAQVTVTDQEKIAAVTAVWKEKYEELIIEKVDLERTMKKLQAQMSADFGQAQQNILMQRDNTHGLETELNQLRDENNRYHETVDRLLETRASLLRENHQHMESIKKLQEQEEDLKQKVQLTAENGIIKEVAISGQNTEEVKDTEDNIEETDPAPQLAKESRPEMAAAKSHGQEVQLQNQLNALATENQELRAQVARLRYSQRQYTVQEVDESLKDEANRLANENTDLKSVVGMLRYGNTAEINDADKAEEIVKTETPTPSEHNQPLNIEEADKPSQAESTGSPSFTACLALLYPDVSISELQELFSQRVIPTVADPIKAQVEFLRNLTQDAKLSEVLADKWNQLKDAVDTPQTKDLGQKVQGVIENFHEKVSNHWNHLYNLVLPKDEQEQSQDSVVESVEGSEKVQKPSGETSKSLEKENKDTGSDGKKDGKSKLSSFVETMSNSSAMAKYQEFVNKTKESVSKLTKKIEKTWNKVKNLTGSLLKENKVLKDFGNSVNKKLKNIGKSVESGWKKAQKHMVKKGWLPKSMGKKKKKTKQFRKASRFSEDIVQPENTDQSFMDGTGGSIPMTKLESLVEVAEKVQHEPNHKQSSTAEDQLYEEYWKMAQFEPDDFFEEGFFEGNNREWHKHQKRVRKLHGRLDRLNEKILMAMDDDDIEDFYEDFDDMQDDMDDAHLPERLMTWLTCQVRWWKSRLVRKHSNEDLVKGCSRHLMHWQLKALCNPTCGRKEGKRCRKGLQQQKGSPNWGPFCQYYQTVILPSMNNQRPQEVDGSEAFQDSQRKVLTVTVDDSNQKVVGDINNNYGHLHYDLSYDVPESSAADNNGTDEAEGKSPDARDQAKWVFERAEDREAHHHDGSWTFKRTKKRAFERNKPWYYKRADHRADERSKENAKN